jgi:hypothetical protein
LGINMTFERDSVQSGFLVQRERRFSATGLHYFSARRMVNRGGTVVRRDAPGLPRRNGGPQ